MLRGKLSEAVMSAPPDLVIVFRPRAADSSELTGEETAEDERVGFEVEKTMVFAPNNAKLISVALFDILVSCAVLSSFTALTADELLGRMDSVKAVFGFPAGTLLRVGSGAD